MYIKVEAEGTTMRKVHYSTTFGDVAICGMENPLSWTHTSIDDVTCKDCLKLLKKCGGNHE